jgi:CBS domain-containing protein
MYRVKDVMTEDVASCDAGATLESVVRIMKDWGCGCVPVVDHEGRVRGLVTDRDAVMCALNHKKSLSELQVAQACTRDIICCEAEDTLERAEMLMRVNQVRRLPVVGERRVLIGVISLTDLARHVELLASESGTGLSPRHIAIVLAETSGVRRLPSSPHQERDQGGRPHPIIEPFFHG